MAILPFFSKKPAGVEEPFSEAEQALRDWGVKYKKQPDGTLLVKGSIDRSGKSMTELPDLSKVIIRGSFDCSLNKLTSLKGAPLSVGKVFRCNNNQLTSLEHSPPTVGGHFYCYNNRLKSLRGAATTVGDTLDCTSNPLLSLEGAPRTFKKLHSDFGSFTSWGDVPPNLRGAAAGSINIPASTHEPLPLRVPEAAVVRVIEPVPVTPPTQAAPPAPPQSTLTQPQSTQAKPQSTQAKPQSKWLKTGESEIARSSVKQTLGYRVTEIFNFEAGTYTQITQNLETKAETQGVMELATIPGAGLVATAAAELQSQGGVIPEHVKLPGLLDKPKLG